MKIFKKSMCLLLAVVMVLGMAITASAVETTETMSVTASKANPAVGEEFSIYLNASGNIAECGCFQMDLYYDQDLFEYVGANTAFTPNHNTNKTTGARYIRLTWLDLTSQTVIPKGQFCELKFKVLKAGEYHFQLTNIVISDYKGDAIMNVATAPGSVDVAATEAPAFVGYAVSASEDKAVTVGESAEVKINVSNSDSIITTFDLRMTSPNDEPVMNTAEVHTIEHLGATFLRNHEQWKDKTVYFGPMGCRTGFYLLLAGDYTSRDIVPLVTEMYEFIRDFKGEVPGASPKDCGNYLDMNLSMANYLGKKYLDEVLYGIDDSRLIYPE